DQRWGALHDRVQHEERSFIVYELPESLATPVMESVERGFPGVKVFSLPSMGSEGERRHIELGIKAHASQIDRAFQALKQGIEALPGFDALQGLHGLQGVNAPPVVEPRR
ncbi:MAG: competence/damage-inducible protein A, partial [Betaproteobacteria bacterium]|nr:competence/damage-inducible protein A [Betaproteobacteria bacterium]